MGTIGGDRNMRARNKNLKSKDDYYSNIIRGVDFSDCISMFNFHQLYSNTNKIKSKAYKRYSNYSILVSNDNICFYFRSIDNKRYWWRLANLNYGIYVCLEE